MSCHDCTQAKTTKYWPIFQSECRGCKVRALASGPLHFTAMKAKTITPSYKAALRAVFGDDWRAGHDEVKAEHARIKGMR